MGVFYVDCTIQHVGASANPVTVSNLLVDTGSEYTWIREQDLEKAAVMVRKRDVPFIMANGQLITRHLGYAILRCQDFETVDEVVFAQEGDLGLLGSRTLEGFGAVLDTRERKLVAAGPYPVAGAIM